MSRMVLRTMRRRMKFSKGCEVTSRQMWYRMPSVSFGTYNLSGFAWIAKSMQDFWATLKS